MKKWFTHHIGGQKWTIYLVSPKSKKLVASDGDECNGIIPSFEHCAIYINRDLEDGMLYDTLLHELLHAWLRVSNAAAEYDYDPVKDERIVSALTPMMHRSLGDLGFKFPPRP